MKIDRSTADQYCSHYYETFPVRLESRYSVGPLYFTLCLPRYMYASHRINMPTFCRMLLFPSYYALVLPDSRAFILCYFVVFTSTRNDGQRLQVHSSSNDEVLQVREPGTGHEK